MNRGLKLIISILLSVTGLTIVFKGVDISDLWSEIKQANWGFILLSIILLVGSVIPRAARWQLLINPIQRIPVHTLFGSAMIGYFGNSILPFRLGELLRAYSLSTLTRISASAAFGTIILERVLDLTGLSLLIVVFAKFLPLNGWIGGFIAWFVGLTLVAFVLIIGLSNYSTGFLNRINSIAVMATPVGKRIQGFLYNLMEGVTALKATRHIYSIAGYTLLIWGIYYIYFVVALWSVNIHLNWAGYGIVLIVTTLAVSIPAAPGYIGTYHAAAYFVLTSLLGTGDLEAKAFAIISHAIGFIPFVLIGAYYFIRSSVHLSDVSEKDIIH